MNIRMDISLSSSISIGICGESQDMPCKYCLSETVKPAGSMRGKKLVKCLSCGKRFYDDGALPNMRVNKHAIVTAMSMYFDGLSVRKVSRQLESIYGEKVSQVTIWKWVRKYSTLVSEYVKTLSPQQAKSRPQVVFVDGSNQYDAAFSRVFYSRYKVAKVELVKRVGIRARETNNMVERLHETLKERTRPMRGFKNQDSAHAILKGYAVNYNFARPHLALKGKTPAEQAGIEMKGWKELIENAIQSEALQPQLYCGTAVAPLQVVRQ
jgi:transposase-like protein